MALTLRLVKGTELTFDELDENFTYLNANKYEANDDAQFGTLTFGTLTDGVLDVIAFTNDVTLSSQTPEQVVPTEFAITSYIAAYHAANPYSTSDLTDVSASGTYTGVLVYDGLGEYIPTVPTLSFLQDVDVSTVSDGQILAYDADSEMWTTVTTGALSNIYLAGLTDVDLTTTPPITNDLLSFNGSEWVPATPILNLDGLQDVDLTTSPPVDGESLIYDAGTWVSGTPSTVGKMEVYAAAGETISAGRAVTIGLQDTSKTVAFPIQYADPEFGQSISLGAAVGSQSHSIWCTAQEKYIIAYINDTTGDGEFRVGELDDQGIEITLDPTIHYFGENIGGEFSVSYDIATTRTVFAWRDSITNIGYARVITLAGFSVTMSEFPIDFSLSSPIGTHSVSCDTASGNVVFHYADQESLGTGVGRLAELDGLDLLFQPPIPFTTKEVYQIHTVYNSIGNRHVSVFIDELGTGWSFVTIVSSLFLTFRTPRGIWDNMTTPFVTLMKGGSECWVAYRRTNTVPAQGWVTRFTNSNNGTTNTNYTGAQYTHYPFENGQDSVETPYKMSNVDPAIIGSQDTRGATIVWGREDQLGNVSLHSTLLTFSEFGGYPIVDTDDAIKASDDSNVEFLITDQLWPVLLTNKEESRMLIPLTQPGGIKAITFGTNPITNIRDWFGIADESFSSPINPQSGYPEWNTGQITILGGTSEATSFAGGIGGILVPGTKIYIDNSRIYRGSLRTSDVGSGAIGIAVAGNKVLVTGDIEPNPDVSGVPKSLNELEDVDTKSVAPQSQQFLQWNTNKQNWVPAYAEVQGEINNLSDVDTFTNYNTGIPSSHLFAWDDFNTEWVPKLINDIIAEIGVSINELNDVNILIPQDRHVLTYSSEAGKWLSQSLELTSKLEDLLDVDIDDESYPRSTGHFLQWQGQKWVPNAPSVPPISALPDTVIGTNPITGQALVWNGTTQKWVNSFISIAGNLNSLSDVDTTATAPINGQALVWNSEAAKWVPGTVSGGGTGGGGNNEGSPVGPLPDGGSSEGTVETEDGDTVVIPPLEEGDSIDDAIKTGQGIVDQTYTNSIIIGFTEVISGNVHPGDIVENVALLPKPFPIILSIAEDRLSVTVSRSVSIPEGAVCAFGTAPVIQNVQGTEGIVVSPTMSPGEYDTILTQPALPEGVVPGVAVYVSSITEYPVITGISADRLSFTVSYPIQVIPGEVITFNVVIPVKTTGGEGALVLDDEDVGPIGPMTIASFSAGGVTINFTEPRLPLVDSGMNIIAYDELGEVEYVYIYGVDSGSNDSVNITNPTRAAELLSVGQEVYFENQASKGQTNGTLIRFQSEIDDEVKIGDYVISPRLTSAPKITSIDINLLYITVNKNIDILEHGDFITFGESVDKAIEVNIRLDELKDTVIEPGLLRDGELLVWDAELEKWTTKDLQLATSLDSLTDVRIEDRDIGQILRYVDNVEFGIRMENITPSWTADDLQDFDYSTVAENSVLAGNNGQWVQKDIVETIKNVNTLELTNLSNVSVANATSGQGLVYNGSAWTAQNFPDEIGDLLNVNAASPSTLDALIWSGSSWNSTEIPRALEDLNALNVFDLDQFPSAGFTDVPIGTANTSRFVKWTGSGFITTRLNNDDGYGIGLKLENLDDVNLENPYTADFISWDPETQMWITRSVEGAVIDIGLTVLSDVDLQTVLPQSRNTLEYDEPTGQWRPTERQGLAHYVPHEDLALGDIVALRSDGKVEKVAEISSSESVLFTTTATPSEASDYYGKSVYVSDNYYIIGAPGFENSTTGGKIEIYDTSTNSLLQVITNPTPGLATKFGESVSISDNFFVVGAPGYNSNAGRIYIYDLPGFTLSETIENPNLSTSTLDDQFGNRVQITNDYIVVSAITEEPINLSDNNTGVVYIFNPATGNLLHSIQSPTPSITGWGQSVAVGASGYIAIGHPLNNEVRIYQAATAGLLYTLTSPNNFEGNFGTSMGISTSGRLVIGAPNTNGGKIFVYNLVTGDFNYTITNPDRNISGGADKFGNAVAISNDYIVASATDERTIGTSWGTVYIFDVNTGSFLNEFKNPTDTNLNWGFSLAVTNDYTIIGAPRLNIAGVGEIHTFSSSSYLTSNADNWVGIVEEDRLVADNKDVLVTTVGSVNKFVSGLETNKNYYLDGRGFLTLVETDYGVLGKATAETELLITGNVVSAETGVSYLNDIRDVDTVSTPPANNQGLVWDSANNRWSPKTIGYSNITTFGGLTDTSVASPTPGQSIQWTGANWALADYIPQGSLVLNELTDVNTAGLEHGDSLVYSFILDKWIPQQTGTSNVFILDDLTDVDLQLTAPLDNDVLVYNLAEDKWFPGAVSRVASLDDLTDVDLQTQAPTEADVIAYNSITSKWEPQLIANITVTSLDGLDEVDITSLGNNPLEGETLVWNAIDSVFRPGSPSLDTISLGSLGDVDTSTGGNVPASGESLFWDGIKWVPGPTGTAVAAFIGDLVDVNVISYPPKELQVLTWDSSINRWYPRNGHSGGIEDFIAEGDILQGEVVSINLNGSVSRTGQSPFQPAWYKENPTPFGTASNDFFAYSMAASTDKLLVSADREDETGELDSGKVYVYNALGFLEATINNNNINASPANDRFGFSLAIYGNLFAISAPFEDSGANYNTGAVYLYNRTTNAITSQVVHPGLATFGSVQSYSPNNSQFGHSISLGGERLAVGAPFDSGNIAINSGVVYIVNPSPAVGEAQFPHIITNPNETGGSYNDQFGTKVALNSTGQYLAVASKNEGPSSTKGGVYIFDISDEEIDPVQVAYIANPGLGGGYSYNFASALKWDQVYPNLLAIGSYDSDTDYPEGYDQGRVFIWDLNTLDFRTVITNPNSYNNPTNGDRFGWSVDMKEGKLLAGATYEEQGYVGGKYTNAGKAYLLDATSGQLEAIFSNPNIYGDSTNEQFGYSVAIGGQGFNDLYHVGTPYVRNTISSDFNSGAVVTFDSQITTNADAWIGIAFEDIDDGEVGNVTLFGGVAKNLFGLEAGSNYYLQVDGGYTLTLSPYGIIGKALSPNTLLITGDVESNTADQVNVLNDLNDVTSVTPQVGDGLVWNGSGWVTGAVSGGVSNIGELDDVFLPVPNLLQSGQVLTWNGVAQSWVNAATGSSNVAIINDLTDVDLDTIPPLEDQVLQFDGATWRPADLPEGQRITGVASENITEGSIVLYGNTGQFKNVEVSIGAFLASIPAPVPSNYALFGSVITHQGDYYAVSAPGVSAQGVGSYFGVVTVYDAVTNSPVRTFYPPREGYQVIADVSNQYFGESISIYGDYLAVGAPKGTINGAVQTGIVYVFRISTGSLVYIIPSPFNQNANDNFGASVSIDDTAILIGSPGYDSPTSFNTGRAYLYDFNDLDGYPYDIEEEEWPIAPPSKIFENSNDEGTPAGDAFGSVVSITPSSVIISAPSEDTGGTLSTGRIYIRNRVTTASIATLVNPNIDSEGFGTVLAYWPEKIIVGAPGYNANQGIVYIFSATTGALLHTIQSPEAIGDRFGVSVAIGEYQIVIGSETGKDGYPDSGKIHVYSNATPPVYYGGFDNPGYNVSPSGERMGAAVAITPAGKAIAGAPYSDLSAGSQQNPAIDRGAVHLFDVSESAISSDAGEWIGIAAGTMTQGETGEVVILGGLTPFVYSGLVPATYYYANFDGTLTTDTTDYGLVGIATNSQQLLILGSISGVSTMPDLSDVDFSSGLTPSHALTWNGQFWEGKFVSTVTSITELDDVSLIDTPPEDTQALVFNSFSGKWEATDIGYSNVFAFNDLNDVSISNVAVGQSLSWNGSQWVPETFSQVSTLDELTDVNTNVFKTDRDILEWDGEALEWTVARNVFGNFINIEAEGSIAAGEPVYITNNSKVAQIRGTEEITGAAVFENDFFPDISLAGYGRSIDIYEDLVVAGNPEFDLPGITNTGKAFIYSASSGELLQVLYPPTSYIYQQFGNTVATNGDLVAIIAAENPYANGKGKVHIYKGTTGEYLRSIEHPEPSRTTSNGFGYHQKSIDFQGNFLLVGDKNYRDPITNASLGRAFLFNAYTGDLVHTFEHPNSSAVNSRSFGTQVAMLDDGSKILIYDVLQDGFNSATAYIYDYAYNLVSTIEVPHTNADTIAINSNYLIVASTYSGYLYIHSLLEGTLLYTSGSAYLDYGQKSLSANEKTLVVTYGSNKGFRVFDIASRILLASETTSSVGSCASLFKTRLVYSTGYQAITYNLNDISISSKAADWVGISEGAYLAGDTTTIITGSGFVSALSGLIPGANYYVAVDGTLFPGATGFGKIGRAISETEFLVSSNTSNIDLDSDSTASLIAGIGDLTDVDTFTLFPTDGQYLQYNSVTSTWSPGDVSLPSLTDISLADIENNDLLLYSEGIWSNGTLATTNLSDIDTTVAPTASQTLIWNESTSKWEAGIPERALDSLSNMGSSVSTPTTGQILVYNTIGDQWSAVDNEFSLDGLTDVNLEGVTDNQFLQYNSTSSEWEPGTVATAVSELTDVDLTGVTEGQYLVYNDQDKWVPTTIEFAAALTDLTDVNAVGATQGQGLIYDTGTNKFELAIVGTSNVDTLEDLSNVSIPTTPNNGDVLKYNGNTDTWEATPTPSPAVVYATRNSFPAIGNLGDLSFAQDTGVLYVWEGTIWYNLKRTNAFYLVRAGQFTGPLTGTQLFQPQQTITLHEIRAQVDQPSGASLIFSVVRSGAEVQQFVIPPAAPFIEAAFTAGVVVGPADEITVDIISGPGTNLSIKFIYS